MRYRHYLAQPSRKRQALRQVASELMAELGEPFVGLWRLLVDRHGPADAARVFARILEAIGAHGETAVAQAVATSLEAGTLRTLPLAAGSAPDPCVEVPAPSRAIDQGSGGRRLRASLQVRWCNAGTARGERSSRQLPVAGIPPHRQRLPCSRIQWENAGYDP